MLTAREIGCCVITCGITVGIMLAIQYSKNVKNAEHWLGDNFNDMYLLREAQREAKREAKREAEIQALIESHREAKIQKSMKMENYDVHGPRGPRNDRNDRNDRNYDQYTPTPYTYTYNPKNSMRSE